MKLIIFKKIKKEDKARQYKMATLN